MVSISVNAELAHTEQRSVRTRKVFAIGLIHFKTNQQTIQTGTPDSNFNVLGVMVVEDEETGYSPKQGR